MARKNTVKDAELRARKAIQRDEEKYKQSYMNLLSDLKADLMRFEKECEEDRIREFDTVLEAID